MNADRELKFTFDEILLPDSIADEPGSHSSLEYTVTPLPALPRGTIIENRAAIYFDFSPAVITNTVSNTIVVTGVDETEESWLLPIDSDLEQDYPNPFHPATTIKYSLPVHSDFAISIYNILG